MARTRALLTENDRELLKSDGDDDKTRQARSRVLSRIRDELPVDMEIIRNNDPELAKALENAVYQDEGYVDYDISEQIEGSVDNAFHMIKTGSGTVMFDKNIRVSPPDKYLTLRDYENSYNYEELKDLFWVISKYMSDSQRSPFSIVPQYNILQDQNVGYWVGERVQDFVSTLTNEDRIDSIEDFNSTIQDHGASEQETSPEVFTCVFSVSGVVFTIHGKHIPEKDVVCKLTYTAHSKGVPYDDPELDRFLNDVGWRISRVNDIGHDYINGGNMEAQGVEYRVTPEKYLPSIRSSHKDTTTDRTFYGKVLFPNPFKKDGLNIVKDIDSHWISEPDNVIGYLENHVAEDEENPEELIIRNVHWANDGNRIAITCRKPRDDREGESETGDESSNSGANDVISSLTPPWFSSPRTKSGE